MIFCYVIEIFNSNLISDLFISYNMDKQRRVSRSNTAMAGSV